MTWRVDRATVGCATVEMGARRYGLGDGERDQPLVERGPERVDHAVREGIEDVARVVRRADRSRAVRRPPSEAGEAADEIGYPVVAKLNGDAIAHKTERGLVRLRLGDRGCSAERAAADLLAAATPDDGDVMCSSHR